VRFALVSGAAASVGHGRGEEALVLVADKRERRWKKRWADRNGREARSSRDRERERERERERQDLFI
jgi:hypothetical protein